jgi:hypothetical protein
MSTCRAPGFHPFIRPIFCPERRRRRIDGRQLPLQQRLACSAASANLKPLRQELKPRRQPFLPRAAG